MSSVKHTAWNGEHIYVSDYSSGLKSLSEDFKNFYHLSENLVREKMYESIKNEIPKYLTTFNENALFPEQNFISFIFNANEDQIIDFCNVIVSKSVHRDTFCNNLYKILRNLYAHEPLADNNVKIIIRTLESLINSTQISKILIDPILIELNNIGQDRQN